jgi:predicted cupin superfamily sugar epimerase
VPEYSSVHPEAQILVEKLGLLPHPEGGFFRETYRSQGIFPGLAADFPGSRNFSTAIYFMLTDGNFSALHRIRSDEVWHFYCGHPVMIIEISEEGKLKRTVLGPYIGENQVFQHTVPAGTWFGSRVMAGGSWSLTGCTVAPGFQFIDFELASRDELISLFPLLAKEIVEFTRT